MTTQDKTQMIRELMIEAFDAGIGVDTDFTNIKSGSIPEGAVKIRLSHQVTDVNWVWSSFLYTDTYTDERFMELYNELKEFIQTNKNK